MIKLIVPDIQPDLSDLSKYNLRVEQICLLLIARNPDWRTLDEDLLAKILNEAVRENYIGQTFIVPDRLVSSRRHMTKTNTLFAYMIAIARRLEWSFVIIAPKYEKVDLRVRRYIDTIQHWGEEDEHHLSGS